LRDRLGRLVLLASPLQESSRLLLVLGAFAALPAAISGLVAHIPYEATGLIEVIGIHLSTMA
jgi:hypothetical protein